MPQVPLLLTLICLSSGDPNPATSQQPAAPAKEPFIEGLWPSAKLQSLLLRRFADDVGGRFNFDEQQRAEVEQAILDRWTPFLSDHRPTLKPIINEYMELKMHLEPPPKEAIQSWAERAMPEFESLKTLLFDGVDDLREIGDASQRLKIEAQALMLKAALGVGEVQLARWRDGDFDPAEFLAPTPAQRRQRREARKAKKKAEAASKALQDSKPDSQEEKPPQQAPQDFIQEELALWEQYVADFVQRFNLDEAQRNSALSMLLEMKNRAASHGKRRMKALSDLEQRLKMPDPSPAEQAALEEKIRQLYGPIDDLFAELKHRVEQLPTASQRAKAEQSEPVDSIQEPDQKARTETSGRKGHKTDSKTPPPAPVEPGKPNAKPPAKGPKSDKDR